MPSKIPVRVDTDKQSGANGNDEMNPRPQPRRSPGKVGPDSPSAAVCRALTELSVL